MARCDVYWEIAVHNDEERLIRRFQAGDVSAFEQLYDRYADRVYAYIALRVGHGPLAEDLTADVFLRALEKRASFRWRNKPYLAWLLRVAHNAVVDHWRRERRAQTVPWDKPLRDKAEDLVSALEKKLTLERVRAALTQLTALQQQVIALRFGSGLSIAETAQVMSKSRGAVKNLQHKALVALRAQLGVSGESGR